MKSLLIYHLITLAPLLVLSAGYVYDHLSSLAFLILGCVYAFLFRPIVDFLRLKALNILSNKEFWKVFGLARFRYYQVLMFGKPKNEN